MRILIEGGELENKGAEAMLRTVMVEMADRFRGATFFVEAGSVRFGTEERTEAIGCTILRARYPYGRRQRLQRVLKLSEGSPGAFVSLWRRDRGFLNWDTILDQVDMVVDISGLRYSDDPVGTAGSMRAAPLVELARRLGKPYIMLPQSFGPFRRGGEQEALCRPILADAALLFARDSESRRHVAALLGRDLEQVPLKPDIAFNFRSAGDDEGLRLLGELGIGEQERPIVCIAPNMRVYERSEGFGASNAYVSLMADLTRRFVRKGVDVVLMPHEIKHRPRDADDRILCELIRLLSSSGPGEDAGRVSAVTQPVEAAQMKAMIGRCDLLIGSRFHAIVAALHMRVPVVAVGWSHKYVELLRDVGLERFVVNYREAPLKEVASLVEDAWRDRESNQRLLEETIPPIEAASASVFDAVREHVLGQPRAKTPTGSGAGVWSQAPRERPAAV